MVGVGLKPEKDSIIFDSLKLKKKIKQHFIDIKDFYKINKIIKSEKPDIIFHLAAQSIVSTSFTNPLETFGTNIIGSTNILESSRRNKISNLVYITSDKCYLNLGKKDSFKESDLLGGLDNYSSSKASAELVFASYFDSYFKKQKRLSIGSARAGNVIGGGDFKKDRIVPDVIKSLKRKKNIILRNPNSTRPWQHVLEAISGYIMLANYLTKNKKLHGEAFNFGPSSKSNYKVTQIVKIMKKYWRGISWKFKSDKNNFKETNILKLNSNKSKTKLKWKCILSLDETFKMVAEWYQNFYSKKYPSINFTVKQIKNYQILLKNRRS